jgi:hypothetical protein
VNKRIRTIYIINLKNFLSPKKYSVVYYVHLGTIKKQFSQALAAHTYNPSYSGGRDQEDRGSKPAQGK